MISYMCSDSGRYSMLLIISRSQHIWDVMNLQQLLQSLMNFWFIIMDICPIIGNIIIKETHIVEVEATEGFRLCLYRTKIMGDMIFILYWFQDSIELNIILCDKNSTNGDTCNIILLSQTVIPYIEVVWQVVTSERNESLL